MQCLTIEAGKEPTIRITLRLEAKTEFRIPENSDSACLHPQRQALGELNVWTVG